MVGRKGKGGVRREGRDEGWERTEKLQPFPDSLIRP